MYNNSKNVINGASSVLNEHFCHIKSSKNILHTKLISIPLRVIPPKSARGLDFSCELPRCRERRRERETVTAYYFDCQKVTGVENKTFYFCNVVFAQK